MLVSRLQAEESSASTERIDVHEPHHHTVRVRLDRRRGRRGHRPHGQARGRHRRRVGDRRRDGPGARQRGRGGDPCGPRHRRRRARRRPTSAGHVARRAARAHRPRVDRRVRRRVDDGPLRHPRQQRRRDGDPGAHADAATAARCSSRPTTSATSRSRWACTTRSRPPATRASCRELQRAPALAGDLRRHRLPLRALRPVAGLRPVEDRERPVRGRGHAALGGRRDHVERAHARRDPRRTCSGTSTRRTTSSSALREIGGRDREDPLQDRRAGRRDVRAGRDVAAARGRRRPLLRGLQRGPAARRAAATASTASRRTPSIQRTPSGCGTCPHNS